MQRGASFQKNLFYRVEKQCQKNRSIAPLISSPAIDVCNTCIVFLWSLCISALRLSFGNKTSRILYYKNRLFLEIKQLAAHWIEATKL